MSQIFVLDAGVLFSTWTKRVQEGTFVTVSRVIEEVLNRPSKFRADVLVLLERLQEETPDPSSLTAVRLAAAKTGDAKILSDTDIELIGLAYTKKELGLSVTLVSSDFAVLNTARYMSLTIVDPSGKFKHDILWSLKCPACNHRSKSKVKTLECPVCGTQMRRVVERRSKIR